MFMGLEQLDQVPFKNIYLHGLVRDEKGDKMSKSKGNVVDPLTVIEKYGADALRLGLLAGSTPGNDIKFSETRVAYFRRFLNKLRNATRYVCMKTGTRDYNILRATILENQGDLNDFDRRILEKINMLTRDAQQQMDKFMLGEFAQEIVDTVWHDFCDRYIEVSKQQKSSLTDTVLFYSIGTLLKLLHPYVPFITEKIWQTIPFTGFLMVSEYPQPLQIDAYDGRTDTLMQAIGAWRNLRAEIGCKPDEPCSLVFQTDASLQSFFDQYKKTILTLARAESLSYPTEIDDSYTVAVISGGAIGLKSAQQIDWTKKWADLTKEATTKKKAVKTLEKQLTSADFLAKAPEKVVAERKESLTA